MQWEMHIFLDPASLTKFSLADIIQNSIGKFVQCRVYTSFQVDLTWLALRWNKTATKMTHNEKQCSVTVFPKHTALIHKVFKPKICLIIIPAPQCTCLWTNVRSSQYAQLIQVMSTSWCTKEHSLKGHVRALKKSSVTGSWLLLYRSRYICGTVKLWCLMIQSTVAMHPQGKHSTPSSKCVLAVIAEELLSRSQRNSGK